MRHLTIILLVLVLNVYKPAFAIEVDWKLSGSGDWESAANWTPSGPPNSGDIVYIGRSPHPAGFTTFLGSDQLISGLTVENG